MVIREYKKIMYYLKSKKLVIVVAILVVTSFAITIPVFAASSNFLQKATEYYERNCKRQNVPRAIAISCYLFDKVSEIEANNATQSAKITELEQRVKALEDQPTPTPWTAPQYWYRHNFA